MTQPSAPRGRSPYTLTQTPATQGGLRYPPVHQPNMPLPSQEQPSQPMWGPAQRAQSPSFIWWLLLAIVGAVAAVGTIVYIMAVTEVAAVTASFLLALIPLTIVLVGVKWLDRWEPEPWQMLVFALLWGAGVSVVGTLVLELSLDYYLLATDTNLSNAEIIGPVVRAPIFEEFTKGLGVLIIFLFGRRHFDGPVDGVVYAATIAAGFAFTENILYFSQSFESIWFTFVVRGLVSPFAHLIFTAAIGLALGYASRSRRRWDWVWAFPLGWLVAAALHALWNGSAVLGNDRFFVLYLVVQVPIFVLLILLMWWLRRQERKVITQRLSEYAAAGWFLPHEVRMLSSLPLRAQARRLARSYGPRAGEAMKSFQKHATKLAFGKNRQIHGRDRLRGGFDEQLLLHTLVDDRQMFKASAHARPR